MASGVAVRTCHRRGRTRQARIQLRRTMLQDPSSAGASRRRHRSGFAVPGRKAGDGAPCRANATWSRRPAANKCCETDPVHLAGCSYRRSWPGSRRRGPSRKAPPAPARPIARIVAERRRDQHAGRPRRRSPAPRRRPSARPSTHRQRRRPQSAHRFARPRRFSVRCWKAEMPSFQDRHCKCSAGDPLRRLATSMSCRSFVCRTIHPA